MAQPWDGGTGRIPANDFKRLWEDIRHDAQEAFARAGESGQYILGGEVRAFEDALAAWWGMPHAVGVASGMDALEIALRLAGCGAGDPVLTTPVSAFATTLAILKRGATPVFADTDEWGQIDLGGCRRILRAAPRIRYFVPVHLYGEPLDGGGLRALREEFGLRVVEDCAQSIGARWDGATTGCAGDLAATSFYPTKNLGAMGDAGAILTGDAEMAARARELRDYGQTAKYEHTHLGYNSRLDELQAAILRAACLPRLNGWTQRRREIGAAYLRGIRHGGVRVPRTDARSAGCRHLFPVWVAAGRREKFVKHLHEGGVGAAIHYPVAIPDQPAMAGQSFEVPEGCAQARAVCAGEVSLPIHPYLTGDEVAAVIACVNRWR